MHAVAARERQSSSPGIRNERSNPSLGAVVTAVGLYTGTILGGAVLTETVFNRPGLGKLLVGAIAQRDYNLIQSGLMVFALIITTVNLLVDLSYALFDPRVKYE